MKIFFIGIGGASLSKLALIYKSMGFEVQGSDRAKSSTTNELVDLGIKVYIGHNKNNVIGFDTVIYSDAISQNNEEFVEAQNLNIPLVSRKQALNFISNLYKNNIAVCGCHGKTTTTALLYSCFSKLNAQPHIGGEVKGCELNKKYFNKVKTASKKQNFFITEACEFKKNLLELNPTHIVMLNIDFDHVDCYKDINDVEQTFLEFAKKLENTQNSILFANIDDENIKNICNKVNCKIVTFGVKSQAEYMAKNIVTIKKGIKFDLYHFNKKIKTITCKLYGTHNVYNALAVISVCEEFKHKYKLLHSYTSRLKTFKGVKRRFDIYGKLNNNYVIHDYAHHPSEIKASIIATKQHFKNNVYVAFEPHTYTRTEALWKDFCSCLKLADGGMLLDIYSAREEPIENITSENLAKEIDNFVYVKNYNEAKDMLKQINNSTLLILGAGTIDNLAKSLFE